MKIPKQISTKTALSLMALAIILISGLFYAFAQSPISTFNITAGIFPGTPAYTIWTEGGDYFAKSQTGTLTAGSVASTFIQAILDSATAGSTILFEPGSYMLTSNLLIQKSLTILGSGVYEVSPFTPWSGITNPDNPPSSLTGTVFWMSTADTPVFRIIGPLYSVVMKDFGIVFTNALTWEGIKIEPAGSGYGLVGLGYGEFDNIAVLNNDGDHFAFEFKNFMHITANRLRSWGGPFIFIQNTQGDVNYGNSVFTECYTFTNKTIANGKSIVWLGSTNTTNGLMNLFLFNRLQINSHAGNQAYAALNLENASYTTFSALDIETDIYTPINIVGSDYVTFTGGLIWSSNTSSRIVVTASDYVSFKGMPLSIGSGGLAVTSSSNFWIETSSIRSANSGSFQVNGETSWWIIHSLYTTPTIAIAQPSSNGVRLNVLNFNATHFQITSSLGFTGTVYWYAEVR